MNYTHGRQPKRTGDGTDAASSAMILIVTLVLAVTLIPFVGTAPGGALVGLAVLVMIMLQLVSMLSHR